MDNTKERALVSLRERNMALTADIDMQRRLFAKFGYPDPGDFLLGHNAVVETEDGKYKLVKRETPVDIAVDIDGHYRSVNRVMRTKTETLGGMRVESHPNPDTARAVLENQLCQSVEPGEVEAWW